MHHEDYEAYSVDQLKGTFPCHCSKGAHQILTETVYIGTDSLAVLQKEVKKRNYTGSITVLCDETTYALCAKEIITMLENDGHTVSLCRITGSELHADGRLLGTLLLKTSEETSLIIAVGGGTMNDTARYAAYRLHIPYMIYGTIASMDGFASTVSPILIDGFKRTFPAVYPICVICDAAAMAQGPRNITAAGLGDILGKYTALSDWMLSHYVNGEEVCFGIMNMMSRAIENCEKAVPALEKGGTQAVSELASALVLSGLAMQMSGNSRPASGCEHHISHYWEMIHIARGQGSRLHGDKVGVAELLVLDFYRRFFDHVRPVKEVDMEKYAEETKKAYGTLYDEVMLESGVNVQPPFEEQYKNTLENWDTCKAMADQLSSKIEPIKDMLIRCSGATRPEQVGASKEDVRNALYYALNVRTRFTILRLALRWGVLFDIVDEMMEDMYE